MLNDIPHLMHRLDCNVVQVNPERSCGSAPLIWMQQGLPKRISSGRQVTAYKDCCRLGISSMSLGAAKYHHMRERLHQAAQAGFKGVEVFYPDLQALAEQEAGSVTTDSLLKAARVIKQICDESSLDVISLQPFMFYDGVEDKEEHKGKLHKMQQWFELAKVLGTDLICIPSNTEQEGVSAATTKVVNDMAEVAEMGLAEDPVIRFAYENLAWSSVNDTWEGIWEVVQKVDRPNFGMILDTFNIAGRVWADPSTPSGRTEHADQDLTTSLHRLIHTVDVNKVFLIQVIDGEKMQKPLVEGHPFQIEGHPSRMDWSRNARLFPLEESRGAYLPVLQITKAIVDSVPAGLGYAGWLSMELFSRTTQEKHESVPQEHAQRGSASWQKLSQKLSL